MDLYFLPLFYEQMRYKVVNNTRKLVQFNLRYDISLNCYVFFTKFFCKKYKNAAITVA